MNFSARDLDIVSSSSNFRDRLKRGQIENPYAKRILDFPGKLYPWIEPVSEIQNIREKVTSLSGVDIYLEFGSGSGKHLISQANLNPQSYYFGFEPRFKRSVRTVEKASCLGLSNLAVIRCEALNFKGLFNINSVSGIYIHYPEPWLHPSKWKHRLLSNRLLDQSFCFLKKGGFIEVKTDNLEYYLTFKKIVKDHLGFFIKEESENYYSDTFEVSSATSEFEALFLSQKRRICYLKLVRI